jgi:hypothetical protein
MSVDIEYAIKTDIRNNPVIRDVDTRQRYELLRIVALVVVSVGLLLFSARQHSRMVEYGRAIEVLKVEPGDAAGARPDFEAGGRARDAPGRCGRHAGARADHQPAAPRRHSRPRSLRRTP